MKPIVLGTDGLPSAGKATSLAIELARETGAQLYVVSAWQSPLTIYASSPMLVGGDIDAPEIERATEAAKAVVDRARADSVDAKSFVRNGEPPEMISQTAKKCDASLIVVGSHGWGPDSPARVRQRLDCSTPSRSVPGTRGAVREGNGDATFSREDESAGRCEIARTGRRPSFSALPCA
jgi:nucleotide-binding universal stress UspA family protein